MKEAPEVLEFYKKHIAGNPKIDMVLFSLDTNDGSMAKLVAHGKYPFAAVRTASVRDKKKLPLLGKHVKKFMPYYVVVDREGKTKVPGDTVLGPVTRFVEKLGKEDN